MWLLFFRSVENDHVGRKRLGQKIFRKVIEVTHLGPGLLNSKQYCTLYLRSANRAAKAPQVTLKVKLRPCSPPKRLPESLKCQIHEFEAEVDVAVTLV